MSFAPNLFLSNIKAKDGLAKPNRFQVILPIPEYIGNFIESGFIPDTGTTPLAGLVNIYWGKDYLTENK